MMPTKSLTKFIVPVVSLVLSHCGQRFATIPHVSNQNDGLFTRSELIQSPGMDDQPAGPFELMSGDILRVRTLSLEPVEIESALIDGQGRIVIPLAGAVNVAGLTIDAASECIEQAMHRYDRFARVVVTVTSPAGHLATVTGAVEHQGNFQVSPTMRVAELLAQAGGAKMQTTDGELTDLADLQAAALIRRGVRLPIQIEQALVGEQRHNVHVLPGDLLYIPASHGRQVVVLGQVRSPRSIPFRPGLRLLQALALAGGPNENANQGDIRVIRGSLSAPQVYQGAVNAIIDGQTGDVVLQAGDVVFVTEHWLATVSQVVNRLTPMLAAGAVAMSFLR